MKKSNKLLNEEQDQWLRDHALNVFCDDLTRMFNEHFNTDLSVNQIRAYKKNHGIRSGIDSRFQKNQPSLSKGKKQTDYMTPEAIERTKATRFKKGNLPHNTLPIGSELIKSDGNLWVKVDDQPKAGLYVNWRKKKEIVWEKHHGAIPEGKWVICLDGDPWNCDITNLALLTKGAVMIMHNRKMFSEEPDITRANAGLASLESKLNEIHKQKRNKRDR